MKFSERLNKHKKVYLIAILSIISISVLFLPLFLQYIPNYQKKFSYYQQLGISEFTFIGFFYNNAFWENILSVIESDKLFPFSINTLILSSILIASIISIILIIKNKFNGTKIVFTISLFWILYYCCYIAVDSQGEFKFYPNIGFVLIVFCTIALFFVLLLTKPHQKQSLVEHIKKYRKWYLLTISILWTACILIVPFNVPQKQFSEMYNIKPNYFYKSFSYPFQSNQKLNYVLPFIAIIIISILTILNSFSGIKLFRVATIPLFCLQTFVVFYYARPVSDYTSSNFFLILNLLFAFLYLAIYLFVFIKPKRKKATKIEVLTSQVEDLQKQLDELRQNQGAVASYHKFATAPFITFQELNIFQIS